MAGGDPHVGARDRPARATRREQMRLGGAFVLGALVVLFAALNFDEVQVNWIVGTWSTPLIVVILVSLLVGVAIGWMASRQRSRSR